MTDITPTLHQLRKAMHDAEATFEEECYANGYNDRWHFYRAVEAGVNLPKSVVVASDAFAAATQAFYRARNGERGFLGKYNS